MKDEEKRKNDDSSDGEKTTQEIPVAAPAPPMFNGADDARAWLAFAAGASTSGRFAIEAARYADTLLAEYKRRIRPAVFVAPPPTPAGTVPGV